MNGQAGVEFLRFGSSIPGSYWGCCAADIIQNFKVDPDEKASMQLVNGDGSQPILNSKNEMLFVGKTYREIFESRIRFGTFDKRDMPNHAFFAILSSSQVNSAIGKKWLAILKENGFEFLRRVNNSVWNVDNFIFVLIRNVGPNKCADMFTPPAAWSKLDSVVPEPSSLVDAKALTEEITEAQTAIWNKSPKATFYTQAELEKDGIPIMLSGRRDPANQPQTLEQRKASDEAKGKVAQAPVWGQPAPAVGCGGTIKGTISSGSVPPSAS